jgi:hypothetical protein
MVKGAHTEEGGGGVTPLCLADPSPAGLRPAQQPVDRSGVIPARRHLDQAHLRAPAPCTPPPHAHTAARMMRSGVRLYQVLCYGTGRVCREARLL